MEIIVEGKSIQYFIPNEVIFTIEFTTKGNTYEEVFSEGVRNVQLFIDEVLLKNHFRKEDMKTRNYVVKEDTKYNEITRQYDHDGYSFHQIASLKFDYSQELMANMMVSISKMANPPMYQIRFGLKDEKECRRQILASAYQDALEQAQAIANASLKTLKYCQRVDFKPFTTDYISQSMLGSNMLYNEKAYTGATEAIINTFTPEDIELCETLYCLWIAE